MIDCIVKIALEAGAAIMNIYSEASISFNLKEDASPLTIADLKSNHIISQNLKKLYPNIPILSEEGKNISYDIRKNWDMFFMVDPLDGTKEFIKRNDEFTVNIAVILKSGSIHIPSLGVVYAPALNKIYWNNETNAYSAQTNENHELIEHSIVKIKSSVETSQIKLVGSRSHSNLETLNYINLIKQKYQDLDFVSMGSSLKLCLIAEGKAQLYPRLGPTMEWDTAAAHAICNKSDCQIYEFNEYNSFDKSKHLNYNKPNLLNPYFIVEANNLL